jgi:hypothetical protein
LLFLYVFWLVISFLVNLLTNYYYFRELRFRLVNRCYRQTRRDVKRIPIDKAQAGQILAEKLTRHDGVLLASQGAEITEGLLRMLSRMNIDTVVIEEEDSRSPEEVMDDYNRFVAELEARFVRIEESSVLIALKKTMLYLAEKQRDETIALLPDPNASEADEAIASAGTGEEASSAEANPTVPPTAQPAGTAPNKAARGKTTQIPRAVK